jgi:hypothetical protein
MIELGIGAVEPAACVTSAECAVLKRAFTRRLRALAARPRLAGAPQHLYFSG